jgi:hypothetical protein
MHVGALCAHATGTTSSLTRPPTTPKNSVRPRTDIKSVGSIRAETGLPHLQRRSSGGKDRSPDTHLSFRDHGLHRAAHKASWSARREGKLVAMKQRHIPRVGEIVMTCVSADAAPEYNTRSRHSAGVPTYFQLARAGQPELHGFEISFGNPLKAGQWISAIVVEHATAGGL